jgi:hypothetical protein
MQEGAQLAVTAQVVLQEGPSRKEGVAEAGQ